MDTTTQKTTLVNDDYVVRGEYFVAEMRTQNNIFSHLSFNLAKDIEGRNRFINPFGGVNPTHLEDLQEVIFEVRKLIADNDIAVHTVPDLSLGYDEVII